MAAAEAAAAAAAAEAAAAAAAGAAAAAAAAGAAAAVAAPGAAATLAWVSGWRLGRSSFAGLRWRRWRRDTHTHALRAAGQEKGVGRGRKERGRGEGEMGRAEGVNETPIQEKGRRRQRPSEAGREGLTHGEGRDRRAGRPRGTETERRAEREKERKGVRPPGDPEAKRGVGG